MVPIKTNQAYSSFWNGTIQRVEEEESKYINELNLPILYEWSSVSYLNMP